MRCAACWLTDLSLAPLLLLLLCSLRVCVSLSHARPAIENRSKATKTLPPAGARTNHRRISARTAAPRLKNKTRRCALLPVVHCLPWVGRTVCCIISGHHTADVSCLYKEPWCQPDRRFLIVNKKPHRDVDQCQSPANRGSLLTETLISGFLV